MKRALGVCLCLALRVPRKRPSRSRSRVDFTETTLANGLRVQLVEDHGAPVIALNIAYDVGSRNERNGAHRLRAPVRAHDVQGLAERRRRRALLPGVLQRRLDERHHQHRPHAVLRDAAGEPARAGAVPRSGSHALAGDHAGEARQPAPGRAGRAPPARRQPALRPRRRALRRAVLRATSPTSTRPSARWRI